MREEPLRATYPNDSLSREGRRRRRNRKNDPQDMEAAKSYIEQLQQKQESLIKEFESLSNRVDRSEGLLEVRQRGQAHEFQDSTESAFLQRSREEWGDHCIALPVDDGSQAVDLDVEPSKPFIRLTWAKGSPFGILEHFISPGTVIVSWASYRIGTFMRNDNHADVYSIASVSFPKIYWRADREFKFEAHVFLHGVEGNQHTYALRHKKRLKQDDKFWVKAQWRDRDVIIMQVSSDPTNSRLVLSNKEFPALIGWSKCTKTNSIQPCQFGKQRTYAEAARQALKRNILDQQRATGVDLASSSLTIDEPRLPSTAESQQTSRGIRQRQKRKAKRALKRGESNLGEFPMVRPGEAEQSRSEGNNGSSIKGDGTETSEQLLEGDKKTPAAFRDFSKLTRSDSAEIVSMVNRTPVIGSIDTSITGDIYGAQSSEDGNPNLALSGSLPPDEYGQQGSNIQNMSSSESPQPYSNSRIDFLREIKPRGWKRKIRNIQREERWLAKRRNVPRESFTAMER
ncbi:hypothetical protein BDV96DRAFT_692871 [Lophiotrema nucula]|uniref:Uncharacterized protein n=1 Tax=Lophiotrema nucula TaxID=690887 RepID=A0A6A5YM79_9PLEO|nr:hypothetical protein BDV96DRAFT_692871 [Lophiotrema nucula]